MARIFILLFISIGISLPHVNGQYFQQDVAYKINAIIDSSHQITGTCDISYTNNSKETLDTFFIHLWMNAFSDKLSAFSEQAIKTGQLDFYFAKDEQLGGYSNLKVAIGSKRMELYSWKKNKDVVYFILPKSIEPGKSLTINTSYDLKLPKNFSRTGYKKHDQYLMYWYPTPAVYDQSGWHPMPYLSMGEFYTEVADFDIELETTSENIISSVPAEQPVLNNKYKFQADGIIDFAIITSKNKKVYKQEIQTEQSLLELKVMTKDSARNANAVKYVKDALAYLEPLIGKFPYDHLSIIDKGEKAKSGMEYPGLITVSGVDGENSNYQYYIVHELLHQYFYSALAFNQRKYSWLDEGLTTYYQQRYYKEILGHDHYSIQSKILMNDGQQPFLQNVSRGQACRHYHAPLSTDVHELDPMNYGFNAYEIPARMYAHLSDYVGIDDFDNGMQQFYNDWKGKHPQPDDLKNSLEKVSDKSLSWFFEDLVYKDWSYDYAMESFEDGVLKVTHKSGSQPPYKVTFRSSDGEESKSVWIDGHTSEIEYAVADQWTSATIDEDQLSMDIDRNNNSRGIKKPLKITPFPKLDDGRYRELYFLPNLTYNTSDGPQLGVAFYNSTFPCKNLKWAVAPSYGFASKQLNGEGWVSYDQYLDNSKLRKLQYKLNAKSFSFRNSETLDKTLRYTRLSPHVSLHFGNKLADNKYSKIYIKPILINEEHFKFQDENVSIENRTNTIFRLGYEYYNFWKLAPSDLNVQLEFLPYENAVGEKHSYTKLTAAFNKAYKFAPSRSIDFRIWGSYFLTNTQRESANYDGQIVKGSSALIYQGFNDYAYDDYFFNRTNQDVIFDNQVSYAGGGFKTPLGSQYTIGQTNDYAFALNVKSDLPIQMPKLLPLKLFLDIGYYKAKSAAEEELTGNSIYSGGVMLEYGEGLFSIYLPLFNSQAIADIYETEGTGLLGKVSFKLDLVRFNPWDILGDYKF